MLKSKSVGPLHTSYQYNIIINLVFLVTQVFAGYYDARQLWRQWLI